jgi:Uncharacterized conserved protein (some members contain a von Willebrand factor type A (vWA) domain)
MSAHLESSLLQSQTKIEKSIEIAAILAFSALQNNDKVGLLAFSDEVELFITPKRESLIYFEL